MRRKDAKTPFVDPPLLTTFGEDQLQDTNLKAQGLDFHSISFKLAQGAHVMIDSKQEIWYFLEQCLTTSPK